MSISQRLCRSPLVAGAGSELLSTFLFVYLGCGILVGSGVLDEQFKGPQVAGVAGLAVLTSAVTFLSQWTPATSHLASEVRILGRKEAALHAAVCLLAQVGGAVLASSLVGHVWEGTLVRVELHQKFVSLR
ncbi:aquaporin [Klebsormidium nitens]|uniref:Aquaporin n=1 Tax=Klebsormidium nitens TaxID=105231 RepID=A0A0U9HSG0_KLENI|nr:aquaporin [Klebsormidium nitens]|eukprot:GAQ89758.1 aquaporin [Klebsormidium nitens]